MSTTFNTRTLALTLESLGVKVCDISDPDDSLQTDGSIELCDGYHVQVGTTYALLVHKDGRGHYVYKPSRYTEVDLMRDIQRTTLITQALVNHVGKLTKARTN